MDHSELLVDYNGMVYYVVTDVGKNRLLRETAMVGKPIFIQYAFADPNITYKALQSRWFIETSLRGHRERGKRRFTEEEYVKKIKSFFDDPSSKIKCLVDYPTLRSLIHHRRRRG